MLRLLLLLLASAAAFGQSSPNASPECCAMGMGPLTGAPLIDLKGTVIQVRIAPGQGMPALVLNVAGKETILFLGAMRYLLERNFNPKVGESAVVKAFKTPKGLIAATVTLPNSNQSIRLRDDAGWPLWRGGRR